jgi:hypothetical protein
MGQNIGTRGPSGNIIETSPDHFRRRMNRLELLIVGYSFPQISEWQSGVEKDSLVGMCDKCLALVSLASGTACFVGKRQSALFSSWLTTSWTFLVRIFPSEEDFGVVMCCRSRY